MAGHQRGKPQGFVLNKIRVLWPWDGRHTHTHTNVPNQGLCFVYKQGGGVRPMHTILFVAKILSSFSSSSRNSIREEDINLIIFLTLNQAWQLVKIGEKKLFLHPLFNCRIFHKEKEWFNSQCQHTQSQFYLVCVRTQRGSLVGSPLDQTKFNKPLGEFGKAWKTRYKFSGSFFN